jgi:biotin operon repressor
MAERLQQLPADESKRARSIYPWDDWLDGDPWRAARGTDFQGSVRNFRHTLRQAAKRRGIQIEIRSQGEDALAWQARGAAGVGGGPERRGQAWTDDEDKAILAALERGMGGDDLARLVGRSATAVYTRIAHLRALRDDVPMRNRPWTPDEIAALVDHVRAGRTNREIAELLDRSETAITGRLERLKREGVELPARSRGRRRLGIR